MSGPLTTYLTQADPYELHSLHVSLCFALVSNGGTLLNFPVQLGSARIVLPSVEETIMAIKERIAFLDMFLRIHPQDGSLLRTHELIVPRRKLTHPVHIWREGYFDFIVTATDGPYLYGKTFIGRPFSVPTKMFTEYL